MQIVAIFFLLLALFILSLRFLQPLYYTVIITIYHAAIHVAALFYKKAKLWVKGRKGLMNRLSENFNYPGHKKIWIHCASLGEFEQGRTVIEGLRKNYPDHKILLTFYSPSGYEVRKNYAGADHVDYMPFDTRKNANRFLDIVRPDMVIFVKYEFWLHHIAAVHKRQVPLFLVSARFNKKQLFFKWYGTSFRKSLKKFTTLFVQNTESLELLKKYKVNNAILAFDTRFDRVAEIAGKQSDIPFIKTFTEGHNVLIAGSTWPKDEKFLAKAFYHTMVYDNFKLVVAPHQIDGKHLSKTKKVFKKYALSYSELERVNEEDIRGKRVLIIDNIGMLSSLYGYGDVCYIGGGFNKGIHNTLEAAVYGKPLIFGPRYEKFVEAVELVERGAAFIIDSDITLLNRIDFMNQFQFVLNGAGKDAKNYIETHQGGTDIILQALKPYLQN